MSQARGSVNSPSSTSSEHTALNGVLCFFASPTIIRFDFFCIPNLVFAVTMSVRNGYWKPSGRKWRCRTLPTLTRILAHRYATPRSKTHRRIPMSSLRTIKHAKRAAPTLGEIDRREKAHQREVVRSNPRVPSV